MRHLHRSAAIGLVALLLAGCFGAGATPGPTESAAPPTSSAPATNEPPVSSQPSAEQVPSGDLEPFTCDLPIHEDATAPRVANITDVRVGTHADYDRVVFEFEFADGLPEMTLDRAGPPFSEDGSGFPIEVDGASFLGLTMRGGTKQTEDGTSSYDGPTEFEPGFPSLVHLVEGGDFEAQSTWYFGLSSEACVRVLTLTDDGAPRLVIDIEN